VLKLPAGKTEIEARQQQFRDRMREAEERRQREEQQRREAAEQRRIQEEREAEELSRRQAVMERRQAHKNKLNRLIQTNYQGTRTILIANPKGGARKTTTTYILGAMIGSTRGGSTIAWDANETMGTLGERARSDRHHRTVVDLLEDGAQHFLDIDSARVGILDAYVRNQGDCHFDVLASDENPSRQDQIDAEGFRKVHDILSHFYRMILVDTGNNI
ncbi:MinD/ParA family ATP-binding protein, partial [Burkholderia multivorans]